MKGFLNRAVLFLVAFAALKAVADPIRSYNVLVSVIDSKTRQPVEGAAVSTHEIVGVTGTNGMAMLKLNFEVSSSAVTMLTFEVKVVNEKYDQHFGYGTPNDWAGRSEDLIPTKPDIVLEVTSRVDEKRAEEEIKAKEKSDEDAAEKLFRDSSDFWPERKNDPYPFIKDEVGEILLRKRWERASETVRGSKEDIESIRAVVIQHMKEPKSKVNAMRWISPTVVMVSSSWHKGPMAAAVYTYVLRKTEKGWNVLAYYMEGVS